MSRTSCNLILLLAVVLSFGNWAFASTTATLTVGGAETMLSSGAWDNGSIFVSFLDSTGQTYSATVTYGQFSTPASIASALGATFSNTYLPAGLCAYASGSSITFKLKGNATFGPTTITNPSSSFTIGLSGWPSSTPTITWATPSSITYGTALSVFQLNATATFGATGILVPGTFSYIPALGTFPGAGNQNLSVTFTPSNTSQFNAVTASVSLTVDKAIPVIQWSVPPTIPFSTTLSSSLLNATANVPGTFAYTPASGTVLSGGPNTLHATFTPTDSTDYTTATSSVSIDASFLPTVGDISTIAGSGSYGYATGSYSGDGGPGTSATLDWPNGVAVDTVGNVYIEDSSNCRIRKVSASAGNIATVAGKGCSGSTYSGEGGLATNANIGEPLPGGIALDSSNNLYIVYSQSEGLGGRILEVNATTGIITTIAGNGTGGDGGPAISAAIWPFGGIAVDKAGNIYFSELADIRRFAPNGIIETIAGNGKGLSAPTGDGGSALLANFDADGIALDSANNLFIADSLNNRVREVYAGMITTVAGNGTAGYAGDGNAANSASVELNAPIGVAVDQNDNVYIADSRNNRIRKVSPATGNISTIAGNGTAGFGGDGGPAAIAVLDYPEGVGVDVSGNLYIADTENNRLRVITMPVTPVITWNTPAPISYGTALSATQLNATASVPGTFSYSPATGTVLTPGSQTLTATFTPTNTAAYSTVTTTVVLTVNKSNPVITWATPGNVPNGTALSSTQLNATASVAGTFLYIPAAGTALTTPGVNALSVFFFPSNTTNYNAVAGNTTITVDPVRVVDSGTVALTVNGTVISDTAYGFEATPTSIAAGLAANVSSSSPVTVTAVDDTLYLQSKQMGAAYNYSYSLQTTDYDSTDFSNPSFAYPAVSGTMDGGAAATTSGTPTPVYSYTVAYDGVSNVTGFTDSVMGNWSLAAVPNSGGGTSNGYDTLNRLVTMHNTATTSTSSQYAGQYLCWSYDAFGNRTQQSQQSTPCPTSGASSSNSVLSYNSLNQLSGVTPPGGSSASPSSLTYDAAGNVVVDNGPGNTYLYDGEGRVCAVASSGLTGGVLLTGYIYDADGTRVAKGTIQRWGSCDPVTNGFQPMTDYILGPGGEQLTEMARDENGQMAWKHTNVWADGKLLATYDRDGLHYHLTDWLGTRRVQTDAGGAIEDACASLPYGDALSCIGPTFTTEHHFTGKERDTESGNDYFGARYYSSSMGRFMSPDWSNSPEGVPYADLINPQSLNLYGYVKNNPLSRTDIDGHGELWDKFVAIFYAKASAGIGFKAEFNLGKHVKAGVSAFAGVEKKFTSSGSTTKLKADIGGGVKLPYVPLHPSVTAEKQIATNGTEDIHPTEINVDNPFQAKADPMKATPNNISIGLDIPVEGPAAGGGEIGIDVDKAIDFGAAAVQNLNDGAKMLMDFVAPSLGSNPGPQATPLPLPTPTNNMLPH